MLVVVESIREDQPQRMGRKRGKKAECRGPAPADPGYSKRGRRRRPIYIYLFIKDSKSNRMRIAQ